MVKPADKTINLAFEHKLAKVTVQITEFTSQFGDDPRLMAATIYSLSDEYVTINGGIKPVLGGNAATAIVCPGKYTPETKLMEVTISDDGRQTNLNVPVNAFLTDTGLEAGKHYKFSLKVGKDAISITKVNVEPWTTYTIDGGVAEEVFPSIDGTDYASLSALQNAVKEKFSDEDVPSVTKPLNIRNQRDLSCKEYKRHYHVSNDSNYVLAIYEGVVRGNVKRSFELVNKLDAGKFFKRSTDRNDYPDLFPIVSSQGYELKYSLKVGMQVLLWEKRPDEIWDLSKEQLKDRLYRVVGLALKPAGDLTYGLITLRYHQEAKQAKDLKAKNGAFKADEEHRPLIAMLNTQFNALIEGVDFELTLLGEIKAIKK